MGNPLFDQFGNNQNNPMSQFVSDFNRLRQTIKNPRQEVERLLQTGAMSQKTFNELSQIAQQIAKSMGN
jgi:hypothetical protein